MMGADKGIGCHDYEVRSAWGGVWGEWMGHIRLCQTKLIYTIILSNHGHGHPQPYPDDYCTQVLNFNPNHDFSIKETLSLVLSQTYIVC